MFAAADLALFGELTDEELRLEAACEEKMQNALRALLDGTAELPRVKGIHVRELIAGAEKEEKP